MSDQRRVLFLPGASGAGDFWQTLADLLPADWQKVLVDFPGVGDVPADPRVQSFDDLLTLVLEHIHDPVDLVAQSMGGALAIAAALARPEAVRSLVLTATSGGVDLSGFDVEDWRDEYRADFPHAKSFVTEPYPRDFSERLSEIQAPTLLVWADRDPISSVAVGRYLESRLPRAKLVVLDHAGHSFGRDRADLLAPLVRAHLEAHQRVGSTC